ncbi:tyrosine-type recombinase/integrase [Treponema sp.]|uniref:tyrosine-type recombinase/integrase n=1 Tax=Treponema sp. TaxID=166 RepID=UPI003F0F812C
MAKLFYLTTKRHGGNYYVQFRLEDGSLSYQKSTGTPNYNEAQKISYQWLANGNIPARINSKTPDSTSKNLEKVSWLKQLRTMKLTRDDVQHIVDVLIEKKMLVSGILTAEPGSTPAVPFLYDFWTYKTSPYYKEKKVLGTTLSHNYFATNYSRVERYWAPFFEGRLLGEITPDDVTAIYQDERIQKLSSKTIKGIMDCVTIPLKWAYQRHMTQIGGFNDLPRIKVTSKEREVLSEVDVAKVFEAPWGNEVSRLANLLAMYTGMRAGEVQGLRLQDIQKNYIQVSHSYNKYNELVPPKNGECRPCPISDSLREALIERAKCNPKYSLYKGETFVFFGQAPSKPMNQRNFNKYLQRVLKDIGHKNPEKYGFHCWRPGFCTEAKYVVNDDRMIRMVSGHKSQQMFEHYSKHIEQQKTIETMGNAAEQLFGDIVEKALKCPDFEDMAL